MLLSPWLFCTIMIQQSLAVLYNTIILSLHFACMVKENDCSLHPFSAQPPQPAHGWVPLSNSSCCTKVQPVCHVRENRLSVDHCQTAKYIAPYITRCTVVGQPWGIVILKQCINCPVKWEEHYIIYQTVLPNSTKWSEGLLGQHLLQSNKCRSKVYGQCGPDCVFN